VASQPIRDAAKDHLLTPKNAAMLIIDYQAHLEASVCFRGSFS
jgi:hypothetical protein